ncbi:MAG TPA: PqqD family protein [Solirubrobacteraceae bacterium]|nr:PqqD family protein [Solirubrobacteraceae bacterium]
MNSSRNSVRPELRVRVPRHVVHRDFPAQTVILNLETGKYHGLNPTAGQMLTALQSEVTVAAAAKVVATRMKMPVADVERDLCELCFSLLERGLVERVSADDGDASST